MEIKYFNRFRKANTIHYYNSASSYFGYWRPLSTNIGIVHIIFNNEN